MNKIKVTQKQIKEGSNSNELIKVYYCDLEYLLYYKQPFAYSSGTYGWKCDYYNLNNEIIISTGYSPIGNEINYKIIRKYNIMASKIIYGNLENKRELINEIIEKFVVEIRKEIKQE